jgi:hypothetical protein
LLLPVGWLIVVGVLYDVSRRLRLSPLDHIALWLIVGSGMAWENWFWPNQIQIHLCIGFAWAVFRIVTDRPKPPGLGQTILSVLCNWGAAFSFGAGPAVGPAVSAFWGYKLYYQKTIKKNNILHFAIFLFSQLVLFIIYFSTPPDRVAGASPVGLFDYLLFFTAWLGHPLGGGYHRLSAVWGIGVGVLLGVAIVGQNRNLFRKIEQREGELLLLFTGWVLFFGVLITYGRTGVDPSLALASRYVGFSIWPVFVVYYLLSNKYLKYIILIIISINSINGFRQGIEHQGRLNGLTEAVWQGDPAALAQVAEWPDSAQKLLPTLHRIYPAP